MFRKFIKKKHRKRAVSFEPSWHKQAERPLLVVLVTCPPLSEHCCRWQPPTGWDKNIIVQRFSSDAGEQHAPVERSDEDLFCGKKWNAILTVYQGSKWEGMVCRHFFGRLEIIPPVLYGRLPYRYVIGLSIAAQFTVHSAMHEICQENH